MMDPDDDGYSQTLNQWFSAQHPTIAQHLTFKTRIKQM